MIINKLDHIVLTVKNIDKTITFYSSVLGMKEVTFGQARVAMEYGAQKINLHELGKEPKPKAFNAIPGSGDLCVSAQ